MLVPARSKAYSNACPRNCMAMSLNASVGPFDSPRTCSPGSSVLSGVISRVPNNAGV